MTAEATLNGQVDPTPSKSREATRSAGIKRFKWAILTPFLLLMAFILVPALTGQLFFSFFQFSIFDGGETDNLWGTVLASEFIGLDLFREVFVDERFGNCLLYTSDAADE